MRPGAFANSARRRMLIATWLAGALGTLAGCSSYSAEFEQVACRAVRERGDLKALSFVSTIRTRGLFDQQLVYQAIITNYYRKPIQSTDEHYRDERGNVAAARTFMVQQDPMRVEDATVSIPAEELELQPIDLPAWAELTVSLPNGRRLAQEYVQLPVTRVTLAAIEQVRQESQTRRLEQLTRESEGEEERDPPAPPRYDQTQAGVEAPAADSSPEEETPGPAEGAADRGPEEDALRTAGSEELPAAPESARVMERARERPVEKYDGTADDAPSLRRHAVEPGDTLSGIARKYLGDPDLWPEIYYLNRRQLESPDRLVIGMILLIPEKSVVPDEGRQ